MPQLNHVLTKYNAVKSKQINVTGTDITIVEYQDSDFISLTDMVKGFGDDSMIYSWMRNRNTLEFIGIWEEIHNPDFKANEFVTFKYLSTRIKTCNDTLIYESEH
ncbi:MAG: KilA-N domain-containing protein [Paludibacteraceae bacterium]|nr:KilA-N domain-containing protein [Paludibacteraceae bacterium]